MRSSSPKLSKYWHIGSVRSAHDGESIRYGLYHKGLGELRRCVVFLNGRTEWLEKYDYIPDQMQLAAGTAFLTWDHRGQGASGGTRAFIDSYDSFAADAASVIEQVIPGLPYVLLAHSMGGLIALYAQLVGMIAPSVQVLCSPLFRLPNAPLNRKIAQPLLKLMDRPQLRMLNSGIGSFEGVTFGKNNLTHSHEGYQRVVDNPYPIPTASFGWINATFRACDVIFDAERIKGLKSPTLVIGGSQESVVDMHGFSEWVMAGQAHASVDVAFDLVPGGKHELLNEIPRIRDYALSMAKEWFARHALPMVSHSPDLGNHPAQSQSQ